MGLSRGSMSAAAMSGDTTVSEGHAGITDYCSVSQPGVRKLHLKDPSADYTLPNRT